MARKQTCPKCGFTSRNSKSQPCVSCGHLPEPGLCEECGRPVAYAPQPRKTCSAYCMRVRKTRLALIHARSESGKEAIKAKVKTYLTPSRRDSALIPPRKCHDCGRDTRDYRCSVCNAAHRAKHGVTVWDNLDDLFTGGTLYADMPR